MGCILIKVPSLLAFCYIFIQPLFKSCSPVDGLGVRCSISFNAVHLKLREYFARLFLPLERWTTNMKKCFQLVLKRVPRYFFSLLYDNLMTILYNQTRSVHGHKQSAYCIFVFNLLLCH